MPTCNVASGSSFGTGRGELTSLRAILGTGKESNKESGRQADLSQHIETDTIHSEQHPYPSMA